jgi:hypothetical protein
MKAYWENGGIAPRFIDLGTRWRLVVSVTPLDRRLGVPQSRSGHSGEERNS